jgi:hypothetical protein
MRPRLESEAKALLALLTRTGRPLWPLADPFLVDLGLHDWLRSDREESYSDWLAWVLQQQGEAEPVLRVLDIQDNRFRNRCRGKPYVVDREVPLREGFVGHEGEIDLLIRFGEPPVACVAVEVKIFDENYEKQRGYRASLRRQYREDREAVKCVVVLRTKTEKPLYGFSARLWEDVCIELRRAVADYLKHKTRTPQRKLTTAAMMLAFVSAVETNVLEYDGTPSRLAADAQPVLLPEKLCKYLRRVAGSKRHGENSRDLCEGSGRVP